MKISELEYTTKQSFDNWIKPQLPLELNWNPKEDITSFELALCIRYLISRTPTFPGDIDINEPYFRHFEIINRNK